MGTKNKYLGCNEEGGRDRHQRKYIPWRRMDPPGMGYYTGINWTVKNTSKANIGIYGGIIMHPWNCLPHNFPMTFILP